MIPPLPLDGTLPLDEPLSPPGPPDGCDVEPAEGADTLMVDEKLIERDIEMDIDPLLTLLAEP